MWLMFYSTKSSHCDSKTTTLLFSSFLPSEQTCVSLLFNKKRGKKIKQTAEYSLHLLLLTPCQRRYQPLHQSLVLYIFKNLLRVIEGWWKSLNGPWQLCKWFPTAVLHDTAHKMFIISSNCAMTFGERHHIQEGLPTNNTPIRNHKKHMGIYVLFYSRLLTQFSVIRIKAESYSLFDSCIRGYFFFLGQGERIQIRTTKRAPGRDIGSDGALCGWLSKEWWQDII